LKASIIYDHYDVAKYLLEKGAAFNINKELGFDGDIYYPMDVNDSIQGAIFNNNYKMLELIYEYGYPPDKYTDARALESSIYFGNLDMLKYFLQKGADPNPPSELLTTLDSLIDACALFGSLDAMKILVEYGTKVHADNSDALTRATKRGDIDMVKYLFDQGMQINAFYTLDDGSHGHTAWEEVTRHGYFDIVKLLVEHGADVNDPSVSYVATNGGQSHSILKYLLENGGDVDQRDEEGNTALMMAAKYNRVENVKLLLEAGADKSLKNNEGKTALDIAKDAKAAEPAKLIKAG
jgi:ankyrin repeat protein